MADELANDIDLGHLRHAARLAWRGRGGVEPNPLVGCVLVAPTGSVVGWGYHRTCGGRHAEIVALDRAGEAARGSTAYVTLEPCNHTGRTGPCSEALIRAGVARVVIGRLDPNSEASGGLSRLRDAGIAVECRDDDSQVTSITDPFVHRIRTGLPWVIAKWAQTLDGRMATRQGKSQWISNAASRRLVHRERGKVDAILTGIGTVRADDPQLTARNVRVRRIARRIVIDPELEISVDSKILGTAGQFPTTIACSDSRLKAGDEKPDRLASLGVELLGIPTRGGDLPVEPVLRVLVERHDLTNVLVESGPGLLGRLFQERLVQEALVFVAPMVLGDEQALPCVTGRVAPSLDDGVSMRLLRTRRRGDDLVLRYRVGEA